MPIYLATLSLHDESFFTNFVFTKPLSLMPARYPHSFAIEVSICARSLSLAQVLVLLQGGQVSSAAPVFSPGSR